jgi:hypothetical protein
MSMGSPQYSADNHQICDVSRSIMTAGGVFHHHTTTGDVNKGTSIHAYVQLQTHKQDHEVDTSDDDWDPSLYDDDPDMIPKHILLHGIKRFNAGTARSPRHITSYSSPPSSQHSNKCRSLLHDVVAVYKNGETPVDKEHVTQLDMSHCGVTGAPVLQDHLYSDIVPLCGTCTLTILLPIRDPDSWKIDVGSLYLMTHGYGEASYALSVTRPGDKGKHTLAMQKTMDSFLTAGLKWLGHFFGFLHENKSSTSKQRQITCTEPCKPSFDIYIVVYVDDDMAVAMLHTKEFPQLLIDMYKLKLESTGTVSLHLVYHSVSMMSHLRIM